MPGVLKRELVDSWVKVADTEAFAAARQLVRREGLLVGGSSGAALAGTLKWLTETDEGRRVASDPDKTVVLILPDGCGRVFA